MFCGENHEIILQHSQLVQSICKEGCVLSVPDLCVCIAADECWHMDTETTL